MLRLDFHDSSVIMNQPDAIGKAGYAFLNAEARTLPVHLWVIISDPAQDPNDVLIVNLTSWRSDHDQTCILRVGDHPWIQHDSCVNYPAAKVTSLGMLKMLLGKSLITPKDPFAPAVLERIREGAGESEELKNAHRVLLRQQELIAD